MDIWLPSPQEVEKIHHDLVIWFAKGSDPIEPPGIKSENLLASACSRPYISLDGEEKYKTLEGKVAALFHSLVKNHAFHNGNKRTALATLVVTLYKNKRRFKNQIKDAEIFDVVVGVAKNSFPKPNLHHDFIVDGLTTWLKRNTLAHQVKLSPMLVKDFIARCLKAGAKCKESKGFYKISYQKNSINISMSTRELTGNVVLGHLNELGLISKSSDGGYLAHDFQDGINPEQKELHRFVELYKKLAHV